MINKKKLVSSACSLAAQAKQLRKFQIQDTETFPHCPDKFCHDYPVFN